MTARHQADTVFVDLMTADIASLEKRLSALYGQRAGRIAWNEDDTVREAWCCCCGRVNVFPDDGQDTCPECEKNI